MIPINGRLFLDEAELEERFFRAGGPGGNFRGLGLVRVAPEKMTASSDVVRRFIAELYAEDVKLVSK